MPRTTARAAPASSTPAPTPLQRVWRAQHSSCWLTSSLHRFSDATGFHLRRLIADLRTVTAWESGSRLLAESDVGLPLLPARGRDVGPSR